MDLINPQTKKAIVAYLSVVISSVIIFVTSGVSGIDATNWYFSPYSWMTLIKALIGALPVLFMAWRENAREGISIPTTSP